MKIDATINVWPALFVGSCANLELLGVEQENAGYITGAVVTCVITDPSGNTVATINLPYLGKPVSPSTFKSFADGNYRGLLPAVTPLVAGTTYKLSFSCANPVFTFTSFQTARNRTA